jgi:hypothetical protein
MQDPGWQSSMRHASLVELRAGRPLTTDQLQLLQLLQHGMCISCNAPTSHMHSFFSIPAVCSLAGVP